MKDVNTGLRLFLPTFILCAILSNSTPWKIAFICHLKEVGINATKINLKKKANPFKSDVFAAVTVIHAKALY